MIVNLVVRSYWKVSSLLGTSMRVRGYFDVQLMSSNFCLMFIKLLSPLKRQPGVWSRLECRAIGWSGLGNKFILSDET